MPQTTPLQAWSVMAGTDLPDMAAGLYAVASLAEKQVNERYATTTARDAAITPAANRKAGMMAWIDALNCFTMVLADGGSWVISPLGRSTYQASQSAGFTFTSGYTDVTGVALTLPAGQWLVQATGLVDYSTTSARTYYVEIYDGTNTYYLPMGATTLAKMPFTLQMRVDYASSTTVKLHAYTSAVDGSQFLSQARITAAPGNW